MPPALGTPEYTNFLVNQGANLGLDLSRFTQANTPANSVVGVSNVSLPTSTPNAPDLSQVKGRVDFNNAVADYYTAQAEKAKADKTTLEGSKLAGLADESLSRFEQLPNIAEVRAGAKAITGFDDATTQQYFAQNQASRVELARLNSEFDSLVARRDQAIEERRQLGGGTTAGTDSAIAQITRDFNFRLNQQSSIIKTKAALMEAQQGNFQEAQNFIKQAVDEATYETKFNLDMFQTFYGRYENQLEKLDSKYNEAIRTALSSAQEAYNQDYQEKLKIGELMINPDYRGAGITLDDTLESAFSKISSGITSGLIDNNSSLFTTTQVNSGAASAGLPISEFKKLDTDTQNYYISAPSTQIQRINDQLAGIVSGDTSKDEVKKLIDDSNNPPTVKAHLKSRLDSIVVPEKGPGLVERGWDAVRAWLGI